MQNKLKKLRREVKMVQNKIEEKSKLTYDERRKILLQEKSNTTEYSTDEVKEGDKVVEESKLIATVESSTKIQHTEEGIRLSYKNLVEEKKNQDKILVDLNNGLKKAGEMTPELQELKENMEKIAKITKAEISKKEITITEERLKFLNGEIKDLKAEIGSRLKL